MKSKFARLLLAATLALAGLPAFALADGAETVTYPSAQGVTNPAASVTLVDEAADSQFYVYIYSGSETLDFSAESFPYYKDQHTVVVKVVGEDPTQPCDDELMFFSGNACDISTVEYGRGETELVDGVYYTYWSITVTHAGHNGPAHYGVTTSSGIYKQIFYPIAASVPSAVTLNYEKSTIQVGGIVKLSSSQGTGTWASSDTSVATVSSAGVVSGVADGVAIITHTYVGYGLTLVGSCTVTVGKGASSSSTTSVVAGKTYTAGSGVSKASYKVTSTSKNTVTYVACKASGKKATVPASVKLADGKTYKVTAIAAKAFKKTAVTKLTIKTTKLAKTSVKGALKSSKVKTVKVPAACLTSYKQLFTKAVCGKSVTVKK